MSDHNKRIIIISSGVLMVLVFVFLIFLGYNRLFQDSLVTPDREKKESEDMKDDKEKDKKKTQFNVVEKHSPLNEEGCNNKKTEEEKEECLKKLKYVNILKSGNIKKCLNLESVERRDKCIHSLMQRYDYLSETEDRQAIDLCWGISDIEIRSSCINSAILDSGDKQLCEQYHKGEDFMINTCQDRIEAFSISSDSKRGIEECENLDALEYPHLCKMKSIEKKYDNDCEKVPEEYKKYCVAITQGKKAESKEKCEEI